MYDLKQDNAGRLWLGVMGLKRGHRSHLLLTSQVLPQANSNLRIVLKGKSIEVHYPVKTVLPKLIIEQETQLEKAVVEASTVGIDKGMTEVLTSSSGKRYGLGFGDLMVGISDRLSDKNAKRNQLRDLKVQCQKKGFAKKAQAIQKHNLGGKKYAHQKAIADAKIKTFINTALNQFFYTENPAILVQEDLSFITKRNLTFTRAQRRHFSSWMKGYLKKQLIAKAEVNGVSSKLVNAAYTSQICHLCNAFGQRKGDKFYCVNHGVLDADYNAARNILNRYFDSDITVYTPYRQVKAILLKRLRLSNQDLETSLLSPRAN